MPTPPLSDELALEAVAAVRDHGGFVPAARALGVPEGTLRHRVRIAEMRELTVEGGEPEYEVPVIVSDKPSIEALIEHKREEFRRRHLAQQSRRWMEYRVKIDGPFALAFFGDPHLDDGGCNWPLLERDIALVRDTPGMYAVGLGDYTNNWSGKLQRLYANQETTRSQGWMLAEWFFGHQKPSGQSIWWLLIKGNHDLWSGSADPLDWMARGAAPLEDWQARFVAVSGDRRWPLHVAHDFKGHSMWNPAHGPMRKGAFDGQAVAYICGDKHNWICTEMESQERPGYVHWAIRARGYKWIDAYADRHGYGSQDYGASIAMVFDPSKSGPAAQRAFPCVEEAAEFLGWKRRGL